MFYDFQTRYDKGIHTRKTNSKSSEAKLFEIIRKIYGE